MGQLLGVIKLIANISPDAARLLVESIRPEIVLVLREQAETEYNTIDAIDVPTGDDVDRLNNLTEILHILRKV